MESSFTHSSPTRFVEESSVVTPLALLLGVVALVAGDGFIREDAYAEIGYALALLSVIGSAACIGYLFLVFRNLETGFDISFAQRYFDRTTNSSPERGQGWPLLVGMMFSPFAMLFSGLAGWVYTRA